MNLSIIIKEAMANKTCPLTANELQVFHKMIQEARYSSNGFLLVFDFTPYLNDEMVNLYSVEYLVDLYILANRLSCSLTKNAPTPKLFFSPYMANSKMFGFMPRDKADIQIYEADTDLYLASYEENSAKGCPLDKETLKAFFKEMQKGFFGVVERPQNYCTLDVILCRNLQNCAKLFRHIKDNNMFPPEQLEELEKKDNICEFLEFYFSNYQSPSIFSRTSFRCLTPDTMGLYKGLAGKKLSELSEFAENGFRSGFFVTRQGRIVQDVKEIKIHGVFYNGEDKLVDPIIFCPVDCVDAKFSERVVGIMFDDAHFIELRETLDSGELHYEYLVEPGSKVEHHLPYACAGYPKSEHYAALRKNLVVIDEALKKLGATSLSENTVTDGDVVTFVQPFLVRNYTNGYFYEA